jgi:ABC-type glycerol-3-phosphate transport system permease component
MSATTTAGRIETQMLRPIRRRTGLRLTYLVLSLGLVLAMLPFWYMFVTSFKGQTMVFEYPPRLWPSVWTATNYYRVLFENNFINYFRNSVIVSIGTTGLTLLVSSMMAYAFARLEFRGREALFSLLLLGMMVPPVMLIIPQFLVARWLDLFNKFYGLVLVYTTMNIAMQTFLLRGVFEDVPRELEEAALMDGAGRWQIFWRIIIPLSGPGLAVVSINAFLYSWEEYAWALVAMQKETVRTLPIAIANFQGEHLTEWGLVFAATIIALIPVILVFAFFQRYFIQGISTTGMKG